MNIPQTRYDLLAAAQITAAKNLVPTNEHDLTTKILSDFDALKIDGSFYADFERLVRDRINTYNNLAAQPLVVATAAPAAKA